jgi:hypothetical protein
MNKATRIIKTWLKLGVFCGALFAISAPVGAACETTSGCLRCTLDGT